MSHRLARFVSAAIATIVPIGDPASAQSNGESTAADDMIMLDTITVTATRSGDNVYESLSGSSVITGLEMQRTLQPNSVADILGLIPNVTTQTNGSDPGVGVNVRGLQDYGRVNVLVDGARQNFAREGHGANGQFYFDPEMMKSVDVTRGPVATIYGSGAIGGVVSFTTIDADDLLRNGVSFGGRIKGVWETNGTAPLIHGGVAARFGTSFDILAASTLRSARNYEDGDGNLVEYSAQDLLSGLVKARVRPADDHEITLSALRIGNAFESRSGTLYNTTSTADTFTAGYRWTPDSDVWNLNAKAYFTNTRVDQDTLSGLYAGGYKSFEIGTTGLDAFNTSRFETGPFRHELTIGGDIFQDDVNSFDSYGTSAQLTPSGRRIVAGAFVQNRISYSGWLNLIGAVRYDDYQLTGAGIANRGTRLSPKITIGITPWEPITVYASYAEGYRAPALIETLIDGFHPPPVSVGRFFPNPDLKPEIAHNLEAGANLRFGDLFVPNDKLRLKLGVFRNRVDDYIEQVFTPFPIPGGYQYQNIAQALLHGYEVEGFYDAGTFFVSISGGITEGKNTKTGKGLNSVAPKKISGTIGVRILDGALEFGARVTGVAKKDDAAEFGFIGDGYCLFDIFAGWNVNSDVTVGLVVQNVLDRQYTQYLNAQASPGMSAKASLSVRF